MIKNYILTAWRYLKKHKLYSFIHIFCLTIGITFALVVGVYVFLQYDVNRSLQNIDDQYVIKSNWKVDGKGLDITTLGPLAKTLREEYPSLVANYYRFNPVKNVVSAGDRHFIEDIAIGDTTFVQMYGFNMLFGDQEHPFRNRHSAVVTEAMAKKLFDRSDVIGENIDVHSTVEGEKQSYEITGVLEDLPFNSVTNFIDDPYRVFVPTEGNLYFGFEDPASGWDNPFEIGMLQLQPGVQPDDLRVACKQVLAKYASKDFQDNLTVELAPLKSYYLDDHNGAVRRMIVILSISSGFILLMAMINFVNISIATSSQRLKEIGLRKVFGGYKAQLIFQFLAEAIALTFLAALLALPLYQLLIPVFNQVLDTKLISVLDFGWAAYAAVGLLAMLTGILAGIYPAFKLSNSPVISAVKGKMDNLIGNLSLRKTMLTIQFTLGIGVFIGALIISKQVDYIFSKDIGYDKEQVMVITAFPKRWDEQGVQKMLDVKRGLEEIAAVKSASLSFDVPDRQPANAFPFQNATGEGQEAMIYALGTDQDYGKTFGMRLIAGSFFSKDGGYIPDQVVLNETAVKALGLTPESAINSRLRQVGSTDEEVTVTGVVADYNYSSMQEQIRPMALFNVRDMLSYRFLSLKLQGADLAETITAVKDKWQKLLPDAPFEYSFLDDKFAALYKSELQLKRAAEVATVLNIFVIALGIFGMVSFSLAKRSKEIAVRKVLGANLRQLVTLFIKDYTKLILVANLIAWPVAYWIGAKWLEGYVYRIQQNLGIYVLVGLVMFLIAIGLILILCAKANRLKPVDSLRDE